CGRGLSRRFSRLLVGAALGQRLATTFPHLSGKPPVARHAQRVSRPAWRTDSVLGPLSTWGATAHPCPGRRSWYVGGDVHPDQPALGRVLCACSFRSGLFVWRSNWRRSQLTQESWQRDLGDPSSHRDPVVHNPVLGITHSSSQPQTRSALGGCLKSLS